MHTVQRKLHTAAWQVGVPLFFLLFACFALAPAAAHAQAAAPAPAAPTPAVAPTVSTAPASPAQPAAPAQSSAQSPAQPVATNRATAVAGILGPAKYHYLGLEPTLRDGDVILTLALEPADDKALRGAINFLVLTDDGLRRVLAGASPFDLDIASSTPLQFDKIGNKYQAIFKASGKGPYTVVVYNTGGKTGGYNLTAVNAVLLDDANQVRIVTEAPVIATPPTLSAATTPTETMAALVNENKGSPLTMNGVAVPVNAPAPIVNALRLSGGLDPASSRAFFAVDPAIRNGDVVIEMTYEPRGRQTDGYVNFYVVDQDGMRRFVYGADLDTVQLATGFPKPFQPNENDLTAKFTASGDGEYTVIPYSQSPLTVTYVMKVDGGQMIDRYGQTNEAKAAIAEQQALNAGSPMASTTAGAAVTTTQVAMTATQVLTGTLPLTPNALVPGGLAPAAATSAVAQALRPGQQISPGAVATATPQAGMQPAESGASTGTAAGLGGPLALAPVTSIKGELNTPYAHNYWTLAPTIRNGGVILTLDYAPRGVQELDGRLNFWVVDEDGMRRIIAGARPEDVAFAAGSPVQFGPNKGKLQAAFEASGKGQYAVIVYNNSAVPATYTVDTTGGTLLAPAADNAVVQALP